MMTFQRSVLSGTPLVSAAPLSRCSSACRNAAAVLKDLAIRSSHNLCRFRKLRFGGVPLQCSKELGLPHKPPVKRLCDDPAKLVARRNTPATPQREASRYAASLLTVTAVAHDSRTFKT